MKEIIANYLSSLWFPMIHLLFFLLVYYSCARTWLISINDRRLLYYISKSSDISNLKKTRIKPFMDRADACLVAGLPIELDALTDSYKEEKLESLDLADRVSSLFLLTGVIGTLIGIFESIPSQKQLENLENLNIILRNAFSAFGVTIIAVILSASSNLFTLLFRKKINSDVQSLRELLTLRVRSSVQSTSLRESMYQMQEAVTSLNHTLNNEKSLLGGLDKVYLELQGVQQSLSMAGTHIQHISDALQNMPTLLEGSHSKVIEIFNQITSKTEEIFENNVQNSNKAFSRMQDNLRISQKEFVTNIQDNTNNINNLLSSNRDSFSNIIKSQKNDLYSATEQLQEVIKKLVINWENIDKKSNDHEEQLNKISDSSKQLLESINQSTAKYTENINDSSGIILKLNTSFQNLNNSLSDLSKDIEKLSRLSHIQEKQYPTEIIRIENKFKSAEINMDKEEPRSLQKIVSDMKSASTMTQLSLIMQILLFLSVLSLSILVLLK
jgi:hypothetical protein